MNTNKAIKTRQKSTPKKASHTTLRDIYINKTQNRKEIKIYKNSPFINNIFRMTKTDHTFSICKKCQIVFSTRNNNQHQLHDQEFVRSFSDVFTKKKFSNANAQFNSFINSLVKIDALISGESYKMIAYQFSNEFSCSNSKEKKLELKFPIDQLQEKQMLKNADLKLENKIQTKDLEKAQNDLEEEKQKNQKLERENACLVEIAYSGKVHSFQNCKFMTLEGKIDDLAAKVDCQNEKVAKKRLQSKTSIASNQDLSDLEFDGESD